MKLTTVNLPNQRATILLPAGTVVYAENAPFELGCDAEVTIEERENTNHANMRRALDKRGNHWFWVQGQL